MSPWLPALIAIFSWWFCTGIILLIVRHADGGDAVAHERNVALTVPVLAMGSAGVVISAPEVTVGNVYLAFVSTLMIWGWIELAFLSGVISGPERRPCPLTCREPTISCAPCAPSATMNCCFCWRCWCF